jgi:hypothetical protein
MHKGTVNKSVTEITILPNGEGLLLVKKFMDYVYFNEDNILKVNLILYHKIPLSVTSSEGRPKLPNCAGYGRYCVKADDPSYFYPEETDANPFFIFTFI